MRLYLESMDLFGHADGSIENPDEEASEQVRQAFRSASKKAWTYICLAVEPEQQIHVRDTSTAKEAWDALKHQFARVSVSQIVRLRQQYYSCRSKSGDSMLDHINRIKSLHDQLREMGIEYNDKELAMTLLASLPESYNSLITALDAVGEDTLTYQKVKGMLLNDAARISVTKKDEDAYTMQRPYNKRGFKPKDQGKTENPNQNSFRGTCHSCKKRGHFARDCPQRKNNPSNSNKGKSSIHCTAEEPCDQDDADEIALFVTGDENHSGWIIDSGATQHMTYERDSLSEYVEFKRPCKVNLGDNRVILAYGKGTYRLSTDLNGSSQKIALKNVLYLPELKRNLLSVQAMSKLGATVVFKGDECRISMDSRLVGIGIMHGKLYMLKVVLEEYVNVVKSDPNMELWHCRFGHLGMDNVSKLLNSRMVEGMSGAKDGDMSDVCEACVQGKQHRSPYPKKSSNKATELFETVHSDVCGPMGVKSFGKSQYFVTFIDEYSRYTEVYFLKSKDEVMEKFKQYVNQVEKLGKRVKNLRSDNGGEYCSKAFDEYLKAKGITHQTTVPYCPEQNGIAERMNRTLVEAARSMMFHAGMPKEFWAEAIHTASYVHNRSPTSSLKEVTPYERMFGQKPDVSNLRVFGCIAFKHIPDAKRRKLDKKSSKCVFVGYPEGTKGYKLYDLEKKSFVRSRDIVFQERTFHDFKLKENSEFYHEDNRNPESSEIDAIIDPNDHNEEIVNDGVEIVPPVQCNRPVGATFEDNFMREVENLNPQRQRRPPRRYDDEVYNCTEDLTADINEPSNLTEAFHGKNSAEWKKAAESEYKSLIDNHTWDLVPPPKDKNVIGSKWVFKVKRNVDGTVQRFKGRLVAQGYTQSPGIDYDEVFAPVVRYTSIRSLLAVANICNWEIHQMDVKTAFLQGDLDDEIYMKQPSGFVDPERPDHV
jgi:hypothetical protein